MVNKTAKSNVSKAGNSTAGNVSKAASNAVTNLRQAVGGGLKGLGNLISWSPIPKLLTHSSNSVTKLTDQKIRWIIREKMKEILSTNDIALLQNVSGSRIRQIWRQYRNTMTVPILAKPGRPSRSITKEEISAVVGIYKEYPCSAVVLETILENRHGIKIPHNRIHKILKNHRLASNDTNKQRRRKWIKY